jgi:pimeloyl-ACP methyl ester carboxylesterase
MIAASILGVGCRWFERIPEEILDARRPNVTSPKFLKPETDAAAPTSADATLLLFIHGIFGDTVTTWSRVDKPSLPTLILKRPEFADRFDAYAFGFPSSKVHEGSFSIPEAAKSLESDIRFHQLSTKYQRIVIVAHSMGGLVALEALLTFPELRSQVPLVVTFGTPYNGSQTAELADKVINDQGLQGMLGRDRGNSFLTSLTNRWKQMKLGDGPKPVVKCAYEKGDLPGFGVIVPETSGTALCDGAADPIVDDHIMMVKPKDDQHDSVKVLTNALRSLLEADVKDWSPLTPLPGRLPPVLERSEVGPVLLAKTIPVGPLARADLEERRRREKYSPPGVDWFVYLSPRYPAAPPRTLQLLPGIDAVMSVIAVDDSRQIAAILDDSRTIGSSFQWSGRQDRSFVRFITFVFPLTAESERLIKQAKDIGRLIEVK